MSGNISESDRTGLVRQAIKIAQSICRADVKKFAASILHGFPLDPDAQDVWAQVSWLHDQKRDPDLFREHKTLSDVIAIYATLADLEDGILSPQEKARWINDDLIAIMTALQDQLLKEISSWRAELVTLGTQERDSNGRQ